MAEIFIASPNQNVDNVGVGDESVSQGKTMMPADTAECPAMIPVTMDHDLPEGMEYPCGAEDISTTLHRVDQYDRLRVQFWGPSNVYGNAFPSDPDLANFVQFFQIVYNNFSGNWMVRISPINSEAKEDVAQAMQKTILPKAKEWLVKCASEGGADYGAILEAAVSTSRGEIAVMERVGHQILSLEFHSLGIQDGTPGS